MFCMYYISQHELFMSSDCNTGLLVVGSEEQTAQSLNVLYSNGSHVILLGDK